VTKWRKKNLGRNQTQAKFPSTCQSNHLKFGKKPHGNKAGESVFLSNSFKANKNLCVMTNIAYAITHFFPPTYPFRGSVNFFKKTVKL